MTFGWAVIFMVSSLVDLAAIAVGVVTGLVARRPWQLLLAPAILLALNYAWPGRPSLLPGVPFRMVATSIWAGITLALKHQLRA